MEDNSVYDEFINTMLQKNYIYTNNNSLVIVNGLRVTRDNFRECATKLSTEKLFRLLYCFPWYSKTFTMVLNTFHEKLIVAAKNKIRSLDSQIGCKHNLELYCSRSTNLRLANHEFIDTICIQYCDNCIINHENIISEVCSECLLCSLRLYIRHHCLGSEKTLSDIYRYLIARAMCYLIEPLGWNITNLIIDYMI